MLDHRRHATELLALALIGLALMQTSQADVTSQVPDAIDDLHEILAEQEWQEPPKAPQVTPLAPTMAAKATQPQGYEALQSLSTELIQAAASPTCVDSKPGLCKDITPHFSCIKKVGIGSKWEHVSCLCQKSCHTCHLKGGCAAAGKELKAKLKERKVKRLQREHYVKTAQQDNAKVSKEVDAKALKEVKAKAGKKKATEAQVKTATLEKIAKNSKLHAAAQAKSEANAARAAARLAKKAATAAEEAAKAANAAKAAKEAAIAAEEFSKAANTAQAAKADAEAAEADAKAAKGAKATKVAAEAAKEAANAANAAKAAKTAAAKAAAARAEAEAAAANEAKAKKAAADHETKHKARSPEIKAKAASGERADKQLHIKDEKTRALRRGKKLVDHEHLAKVNKKAKGLFGAVLNGKHTDLGPDVGHTVHKY